MSRHKSLSVDNMKDSAAPDFSFFSPNDQIKKDNMEVDTKEGMDGNTGESAASEFKFGPGPSDDQSVFTFQSNSSASTSTSKPNESTRRRMIPPTSIPNFPTSDQPRDQPFSPSPSKSPAGAVFPFKSPSATPPHPPSLGTLPPAAFGGGAGGMQSPWLALAASSGAPTPSLDGPGRNSPQLGSPFEKLNIGGSWSGANLSDSSSGRRASLEPPSLSLSASPGKSSLSSEFSFGSAMDGQKSQSMDNSKKDRDQDMAIDAPEPKQKPPLPATLAARRASLPRNHVNIHGPALSKTNSPLAISSITNAKPSTTQKAQPLAASSLGSMLGNPNVLVLDLRPPSSFQVAHLPKSHSLPIPSTLLRRPAFTIEKMIGMLHGDSVQAVSQWRNMTDIILIDQDSQQVPPGHILDGLASKFAREGYTGHIWFVKGGHGAVRASGQGLIQSGEEEPSTPQIPGYTGPGGAGLMAGGMGRMAFQNSSTGGGGMLSPTATTSGGSRTPGLQLRLDPFEQQSNKQHSSPTSSKKSSSYRGHSSMGDEATASTLQPANPFFDNIRQNMELSHGGITDRIPLGLPEEIKSRASELPSFLAPLASMSDKDASDVLARQFYQVELGEQKRLQAVMNWHTQDSGAMTNAKQAHQDRGQRSADKEEVQRLASWGAAQLAGDESSEVDGAEYYPFSITAGVERGTKNRYKNIWPYDFSRVRLGSPEDDSDYINASYIQPRGTSRRYIATQGPMDATYRDFWTLVWEQGVQVIAMITKQFEGGSIKCGNYWEDKKYGPIRVHQVSHTGGEDQGQTANAGFDFGMATATPKSKETEKAAHIKRVFEVTNDDHPESAPRKITQIQCVSWPDFDVPESADVLLDLIADVDEAFKDVYGASRNAERQDQPPILVHSGVGRTGSFIVVDAILDGLRRERFAPKPTQAGEVDIAPRPIASRNSSADSANPIPTLDRSVGIPTPIHEEPGAEQAPPKRMSLSHANMVDHQRQSFMQHRGDGPGSASAHSTHSLPTSNGNASYTSSERRALAKTLNDFGVGKDMRATTASKDRGNAATPLSEMDHPVLDVLEGIRVQRMSLVQSLRQFVFVHRAIMTAYIQLIDGKRPTLSHAGSSGPTVLSIPTTASTTTTDDDTHSKRRASPTELVHDDPMSSLDQSEGSDDARGGSLVKRPSFKKMRPSAMEGITAPTGSSRQMSPKKGV